MGIGGNRRMEKSKLFINQDVIDSCCCCLSVLRFIFGLGGRLT